MSKRDCLKELEGIRAMTTSLTSLCDVFVEEIYLPLIQPLKDQILKNKRTLTELHN